MLDVDKIMRFENGDMGEDEVIEMFQGLIDSGLAWSLQGFYGRLARDLIQAGYCQDTHGVLKFSDKEK
jgi:hypothetical protein